MNGFAKALILLSVFMTAGIAQPHFLEITAQSDVVQVYEKFELMVELTADFDNPYDPADVHLTADFQNPAGGIVHVDGFWMQDYTDIGSGILVESGSPGWKVRFTPDTAGNWNYWLTITDHTGSETSGSFTFTCEEGVNPGFVRMTNDRYLSHDDGSQYFAIGENMGWWQYNGINDYEEWMNDLSDAGGNFIRIWMCSWGTGIEWNDTGLGNYSSRQDRAFILDWIIEHAAETGIYIMLCLNNHGQVSSNVNPEWGSNPYNAANGGPCQNTWDFFTSQAARDYYEQRLKYIVARWGYSPNIMAWESFNEVEWTNDFSAHQDEITQWHLETSQTIADLDVYDHLITTSYAMADNDPDTWELPIIDFTQTHHYTAAVDPQTIHSNWVQTYLDQYQKPTLIGEFGLDNFLELDPSGVDLHNSLWASAMSGSFGSAMTWWWDSYVAGNSLYHHFEPLSQFMQETDLLTDIPNTVRPECRTDDAGDLSVSPGYTTWGQAPENDFTILPDGTMDPDASGLGQYLFGAVWNTQHRNPPTFHVDYPSDGTFRVVTGANTGTSPTIQIRVDGSLVLSQSASVNSVYSVDVSAGSHEIFVSNQGTDWIQIANYEFSNLVSRLRGFALESGSWTAGWVQNREYNWYHLVNSGLPEFVTGGEIVLDLAQGSWDITWVDCLFGAQAAGYTVVSDGGATVIPVPDLLWDMSFRAVYSESGCLPDGDINLDGNADILDIVMLVGHILGDIILEEIVVCHGDLNGDSSIDVLDVVLLVELILQ